MQDDAQPFFAGFHIRQHESGRLHGRIEAGLNQRRLGYENVYCLAHGRKRNYFSFTRSWQSLEANMSGKEPF
jgi:hypothetical protein